MMNLEGQGREFLGVTLGMAYLVSGAEPDASGEGAEQPEGEDRGLEEAARREHEYLRERLREELGREPTPEELDEWLRRHTEGY
jgi:hypothetical protein